MAKKHPATNAATKAPETPAANTDVDPSTIPLEELIPGLSCLGENAVDPARMDESDRGPETPSDHTPILGTILLPELAPQPGSGYCQRHVDARLTPEEAQKGRRLLDALQREGSCLLSGRPIRNLADVMKWLLQQIPANC